MTGIASHGPPVMGEDGTLWEAMTTIARTRATSRLDHHRAAYHDLVHSIASLEEYLARHALARLDEDAVRGLTIALCGVSDALGELHLYDRAVIWTERLRAVAEQNPAVPSTIATAVRRADALWDLACSERLRDGSTAAKTWFEQARAAYVVASARASETSSSVHRTQELAAMACACDLMTGRRHADTRLVFEEALEMQRRAPRGYGRHLRLAAAVLAREEGRDEDAAAAIARAADRVDWHGLGSTDLVILMEHAAMSAPALLDGESPMRTLVRRLVDDWHRRARVDRDAFDEQLAIERATIRACSRDETDIDTLTGVGNRRAVDAGLAALLARARAGSGGFSIAFADVDDFATINGDHGHRTGDAVLRRIGRALQVAVGEAVVARCGGDEFVVLAPDQTPAELQRLLTPLTRIAPFDETEPGLELGLGLGLGLDVEVTLTIGIARADAKSTVSTVLAAADVAMIDGKRAGKARVVVVDG